MNTSLVDIKVTLIHLLRGFAPEADFTTFSDNDNIRQTLEIDSFDFLNFMIGISDSFGIEIPEADYGKLVTLMDVMHYIQAHRKKWREPERSSRNPLE